MSEICSNCTGVAFMSPANGTGGQIQCNAILGTFAYGIICSKRKCVKLWPRVYGFGTRERHESFRQMLQDKYLIVV